jgi:hypothetical protein
MSEHIPLRMDLYELSVRDLGHRTKRYFLQEIIMHLINKYVIYFDELFQHLYENFNICLILENNYYLDDMIDGVQ